VRGQRGELTLQLVQPPKLAVLDCPLQESRDQHAECVQQLDLWLPRLERPAAFVAGHKPETAPPAEQWHDHERADPETLGDLRRHHVPRWVLNEDRPPGRERAPERAEARDRQRSRESSQLRG